MSELSPPLHPSLPPLHTWPGRILALPRDPRGYPGVVLVWVTTGYRPFRARGGTLFRVGEPSTLLWFAEGRPATRAEVLESIDSGLPLLRQAVEAEREAEARMLARREFDASVAVAMTLVPAE